MSGLFTDPVPRVKPQARTVRPRSPSQPEAPLLAQATVSPAPELRPMSPRMRTPNGGSEQSGTTAAAAVNTTQASVDPLQQRDDWQTYRDKQAADASIAMQMPIRPPKFSMSKRAPSETRPIRAFAQGLVAETAKFYGTKEERDLLAIQEAELQEQARMRNMQKIDKLTRELQEAHRRNEQYKPQKLSRNPTASSITGDMEQEVPTPWSSAEENEPPDGSKTPPRQRPWGFPGGSPGGGPPGGGSPGSDGGGQPPPPPPPPDNGTLAVLSQTVSLLARVIESNLGKDTTPKTDLHGEKEYGNTNAAKQI